MQSCEVMGLNGYLDFVVGSSIVRPYPSIFDCTILASVPNGRKYAEIEKQYREIKARNPNGSEPYW